MGEEGSSDGWAFGPGNLEPEPRSRGAMAPMVIAAIVIAGLYFARPVLEPFAFAVLLSLLLAPAVRWLHYWGFGRVASVAVAVFLAFVVILGFAATIGEEAISLAQQFCAPAALRR